MTARRIVSLVLVLCLLAGSLVVTILDAFRPETLTWKRVFGFFGLGSVSDIEAPLKVHVLDVGKADCIVIECEDKVVLIDSGYYDFSDQILNYLRHLGVDGIDLAVLTHPHSDHVGSMAKLIAAFPTDRLLLSLPPDDLTGYADSYATLLTLSAQAQIEILHPAVDDSFELGALYFYVLSPSQRVKNENDNSIVLRMEYGDVSFLFMGDAEEPVEKELCATFPDLRADVIKIGHHGSATSTSDELLDAVLPRYAVISVGEDANNLPKESVLERLRRRNIECLRTDFDGTCIFTSDGEKIEVKTEEGN